MSKKKERKTAVALLIHSDIKPRLAYGTIGISFQFRNIHEQSETYIRTFNLVTNVRTTRAKVNSFLSVIIGHKDNAELRANHSDLLEEIKNSDHKLFNLSLEDSLRSDKKRNTIWDIVGIELVTGADIILHKTQQYLKQ